MSLIMSLYFFRISHGRYSGAADHGSEFESREDAWSETRYAQLRAISFNSPYSYPVEINANEEPRRYCSMRGRSLRSWSANVNFATSGVFVSPSFKSLALQGLTDVVSQSPNSWPTVWWLWRAAAVLRGARRLCGNAARGDSH